MMHNLVHSKSHRITVLDCMSGSKIITWYICRRGRQSSSRNQQLQSNLKLDSADQEWQCRMPCWWDGWPVQKSTLYQQYWFQHRTRYWTSVFWLPQPPIQVWFKCHCHTGWTNIACLCSWPGLKSRSLQLYKVTVLGLSKWHEVHWSWDWFWKGLDSCCFDHGHSWGKLYAWQ